MNSILTGDMKKLIDGFAGQLEAFKEPAYFRTRQRITFAGKEYDVVRSYDVHETPGGGLEFKPDHSVGVFSTEPGGEVEYARRQNISHRTRLGEFGEYSNEELTRLYNESKCASETEFLQENRGHMDMAEKFGVPENGLQHGMDASEYVRNFKDYIQSPEYAKATAGPVKLESGSLELNQDNYYGIDFKDYPVTEAIGPDGTVIEGSGRIDVEYSLYSDGTVSIDVGNQGWKDADIARLEAELTGNRSFQIDMSDRYERNVGSLIENNSEIISRDFNGNVNAFLDRELNPELTRMHLQSSDVLWEQPYTTPEGIEGVITTRCDGTVTAEVPQGPNRESWNYNDYEAKVEAFQSSPEVEKLKVQAEARYEWAKENGFPNESGLNSTNLPKVKSEQLAELSEMHLDGTLTDQEYREYSNKVMDGEYLREKGSMEEVVDRDIQQKRWEAQEQHWEDRDYRQDGPEKMEAEESVQEEPVDESVSPESADTEPHEENADIVEKNTETMAEPSDSIESQTQERTSSLDTVNTEIADNPSPSPTTEDTIENADLKQGPEPMPEEPVMEGASPIETEMNTFDQSLQNLGSPDNPVLHWRKGSVYANGQTISNTTEVYKDGSVYTNNGSYETIRHPDGSMDIRDITSGEVRSLDAEGNLINRTPNAEKQMADKGYTPSESQKEVWQAQDKHWQNAEKMEAAHQEDIRESREDVWKAQDQHWEERGYRQDGPRTMEAPVEPEIEPAANYTPQTVHVETVDGMSGDFHIDAHGNIQVFGDSIQGAPGLSSAEHVEAFMAEPSVQNAMLKAESTGTMLRSNVNGLELTRDFTINTPEGPMRAQMTMDMQGHADITFPDRSFDTFEDYSKAEAEAFQSPEAQSIQGNMENCRNVLNNQFTAIENRISNLEGLDMTPSETLGRMETEAFTIEQPNGRLSFHSIDAADMMDANEALLNMPEADLTNSLNALGQENPEVANWLSELFSTPGMKIALLVGLAAIVALVAMSVVKANRLAEEQRLAEAQQERQETVAKELGDAKSNPDGHEKEAGNTAAMARSAADHEENQKSAGMKQPDSSETDTASSSQKNENVAPAMEETIETPDKQQDISEQEHAKAAPDNNGNIPASESSKKDEREEKSEESDKENEKSEKDEAENEEEKAQKVTENNIAENIAKGAEAEPQNVPESTSHASDEKEKEAKDKNPAKEQPEMHTADTSTPDITDAEDSKGVDETVTDTEKAATDAEKTIDGEMAEEAKDGDSHDKKEPAGTKEAKEEIKENPVRKDSVHEESVKDKEDKDETVHDGTVHDGPEPEPQVHDDTMIPESPDTPDPVIIPTPEDVSEPAAEKHENALISWEIDKNSGSLILGGDITKKGLERVLAEAEKDALANGYRIDNLVIGNETSSIQPCALTALEGRSPDSKVNPMNLVLEIDKAHKDAYRSIEACKVFIIPESLANVAIKNYAPDACLSIKDNKTFRRFHTVITQDVDYIPDNFMGYAKIDQLLQRDTDPDHRMSIGRNAFGQEGPEAERILKTKDPVGHAPNEKTDEKTEHEKMDEHLQPLGHKLSNEHGGWMMDEKESRESLEKLNASMERDNTNRIAALTQARDELIKKRDELVASAKNAPSWVLNQYKETEAYTRAKENLLRNGKLTLGNGISLSLKKWDSGQKGGCDVWDKKIAEMQKKADKLIERYEKLNLPELDGVINDLKDLKNRDFKAERVKLVNKFINPYLDAVVCSEYMKTPEFAEKMKTFDNKESIKGYKELTEAIGKMDAEIAELGGKHQEILSAEDMQHVRNARDNKEMLVGISVSSLGDSAFENQALRFIPGEDAKTYIRHLEKSLSEMNPENQKLAREMIDNVRRGKVFTVPNGVKLGAYALANTNSEGLAEDVNNHISLNAIKKKYDAEIERLKANREELVSKGQDTTQVDKQIREKDAEYKSRRASMLSEDASDRAVIHDNAVVNNDRAYLFDVKCNDEKMQKITANCGKEIPEKGMMANISGKSPKKHKAADLDKEKRDYEKKERRDSRGMAVLGGLGGALSGMTDKDFSATKGLAYAIGTPLFFLALLIGKLGKKGIDCLKEMKNGKQPDLIKMYGLDGNTPEALKLAGRARYELASAVAIAAEKGPGESLLADLKNISEHLDPDRPEASSLISGSKDAQKLAVALVNSDYSLEELGRLAIEFGSMQDGEHRAEEAKNLLESLEKQIAEKEVQIKASSKKVGEKSLYNQNSRKIEDSFNKDLAKKEKEAEKILRENGRDASGKKLTKTEKIKMKAEDKARNNARKPGKGHTQEQ